MCSTKGLNCKKVARKMRGENCLYAVMEIIASSAPIFMKLSTSQRYYLEIFYKVKVKQNVKVTLHQAIKAQKRSKSIALLFY
jgi:hypothetical protein